MTHRLTLFFLFFLLGLLPTFVLTGAQAQGNLPANSSTTPLQYRIVHIVLRGPPLQAARAMVDTAKASGYNAIQFMLTDGVMLDNAPWAPNKSAWSKAQLLDWVAYARSRGLEVIPEVKLLTHQEKFFQAREPDLLFNAVTYDPRKEVVYQKVFPLLNEIIDSIRPIAIHIGHDEVVGWNKTHAKKMLNPGETPLPANLYLQDVLRIHAFLKSKGVATWMWGDMLFKPEEFPSMLARHLHGGLPGYGKPLRDQLPRDIVICDWHYFDQQKDFPTLSILQSEGFKVIGATWKNEKATRNFARYALSNRAHGMMATTWYNFHAKDADLVNWIVRSSGAIFSNPDAAVAAPAFEFNEFSSD
jgi:hypothetical protein